MASISIPQLSPADLPPVDKAIRAVVTLIWPYSSSTKQCAFLLAETDFRLRNKRGQVRVRFANGSAEAVARAKIGIGDEVLLELRGASWAGETTNINTPGRSVDGELLFRGELSLTLLRRNGGEETHAKISVHESTPPPQQDLLPSGDPKQNGSSIERDGTVTPRGRITNYLRSSLGHADVVPIYSSPAFVRRLQLSEERQGASWDPFAEIEEEFEQQRRKKQRISFGNVGKWRVTDRTPSPEQDDVSVTKVMTEVVDPALERSTGQDVSDTASLVASNSASQDFLVTPSKSRVAVPTTFMPPPPLPKLVMPNDIDQADEVTAQNNGPSTPKLQPVPSSNLPLPSPFPVETSPLPFSSTERSATAHFPEVRDGNTSTFNSLLRANPSDTSTPVRASFATQQDISTVQASRSIDVSESRFATEPNVGESSLVSSAERKRSDQAHLPSSQVAALQVENLSDTEEDDEMYAKHVRNRFPTFDERGRRRVDHGEDGISKTSSENSKERQSHGHTVVLKAGKSDSGDEGGDEDEIESEGVIPTESTESPSLQEQAQPDPDVSGPDDVTNQPGASKASRMIQASGAPSTPAGPSVGLFGFDNAADMPPRTSTPHSERDKIMRRTYSSLFGFKASPSPERKLPGAPQSGTAVFPPAPPLSLTGDDSLNEAPPPTPRDSFSLTAATAPRSCEADASVEVDQNQTQHASLENKLSSERPVRHQRDESDTEVAPPSDSGATDYDSLDAAPIEQAALRWQAAEAIAETSDGLQVADVEDGSLLEMIRADETEHEATTDRLGPTADGAASELQDSVGQRSEEFIDGEAESDDEVVLTALKAAQEELLHDGSSSLEMASASDELTHHTDEQDQLRASHPADDIEMADAAGIASEHMPVCYSAGDEVVYEAQAAAGLTSTGDLNDPLPDGESINKALGEAIAPVLREETTFEAGPESPVFKPSQGVEVIDLGSSDDEEDEDTASERSLAAEEFRGTEVVPHDGSSPGRQDLMPEQTPFAGSRRSPTPELLSAQPQMQITMHESQKSAPDLLTTAQTILQRPEVGTPSIEQLNKTIPTAVESDSLWTQTSRQGSLEAEVMLVQSAVDLAPQPVTSVAAQNLDTLTNSPSTPIDQLNRSIDDELTEVAEATPVVSTPRGTADLAIEILSSSPAQEARVQALHDDSSRREKDDTSNHGSGQVTAALHVSPTDHDPSDLDMSSNAPLTSSPRYPQHQPDFSFHSEHESEEPSHVIDFSGTRLSEGDEQRSPQAVHPTSAESHVVDEDMMELVSFEGDVQQAQRVDFEVDAVRRVPISPEESQPQEESESMLVETQLPYGTLPPTPQLTQGDSLITPEIVIEAEIEAKPVQTQLPATRRIRRTRESVVEPDNTPVRRSTRKSHANAEATLEDAHTPVAVTAARHTRSRSAQIKEGALGIERKAPARKSPRKGSEDVVEQKGRTRVGKQSTERLSTPEPVPEAAGDEVLISPTHSTPVRRSRRRSLSEVFMLDDSGEAIAVENIPDKPVMLPEHTEAPALDVPHHKAGHPDGNVATLGTAAPKATPATKQSFTSRLGNVPEAISNWFSPRRPTRIEPKQSGDVLQKGPTTINRNPSNGFATELAYYTPLSNLQQKLNASSQSIENAVEVLAVVTDHTSPPERAKGGPKHYFTVFHVTDPSLAEENDSVRVEVFRPWHAKLPTAEVGDIVLLRLFAVKSRTRKPYLLSTDSSGWCVWRYGEESTHDTSLTSPKGKGKGKANDTEKPVWAQRNTRARSGSHFAVREEVKGPPVELGNEERERARELRVWWVDSVNSGTRAPAADIAAKTRSGKL